jgi:hypothetical protein
MCHTHAEDYLYSRARNYANMKAVLAIDLLQMFVELQISDLLTL